MKGVAAYQEPTGTVLASKDVAASRGHMSLFSPFLLTNSVTSVLAQWGEFQNISRALSPLLSRESSGACIAVGSVGFVSKKRGRGSVSLLDERC